MSQIHMQTRVLAAYVKSRNLRFAGAPLTLRQVLQLVGLADAHRQETVDSVVIERVAKHLKVPVDDLVQWCIDATPAPQMPSSVSPQATPTLEDLEVEIAFDELMPVGPPPVVEPAIMLIPVGSPMTDPLPPMAPLIMINDLPTAPMALPIANVELIPIVKVSAIAPAVATPEAESDDKKDKAKKPKKPRQPRKKR